MLADVLNSGSSEKSQNTDELLSGSWETLKTETGGSRVRCLEIYFCFVAPANWEREDRKRSPGYKIAEESQRGSAIPEEAFGGSQSSTL